MSKLTKLNQKQVEMAFLLLDKMWMTQPSQEFLALPIPKQIPKSLEHLELMEWEALSWSLNQLMEQKSESRLH